MGRCWGAYRVRASSLSCRRVMNIYPFSPSAPVQDRRSVQAPGGPIAFIGATGENYSALSARIGISHPKSTCTYRERLLSLA